MNDNVITIKYYSGRMVIDLQELFYYDDKEEVDPDIQVIHYSKLQRVTKLFKFLYGVRWNNEESIEQCLNWLNTEKDRWQQYLKTNVENLNVQAKGSTWYRKYKREVSNCERFVKRFDTAIRILTEGR